MSSFRFGYCPRCKRILVFTNKGTVPEHECKADK